MVDARKRDINEKKFGNWENLSDGARRYWYDIPGRTGWKARYIKETDAEDVTTKFWQEIYNENGILIEIHEKYPEDNGHQSVQEDQ